MEKLTRLQRDILGILKKLGGEASTQEISAASGSDRTLPKEPRLNNNSIAQSLSRCSCTKYLGGTRGQVRWKLLKDPDPLPVKEEDPQIDLEF